VITVSDTWGSLLRSSTSLSYFPSAISNSETAVNRYTLSLRTLQTWCQQPLKSSERTSGKTQLLTSAILLNFIILEWDPLPNHAAWSYSETAAQIDRSKMPGGLFDRESSIISELFIRVLFTQTCSAHIKPTNWGTAIGLTITIWENLVAAYLTWE